MITTNTPYKLAEILMDTWPQLFWLKKTKVNKNGIINNSTTNKGVV